MNDTNEEIVSKKAHYFYSKEESIHIDTIKDKFYNGIIIECSADFIIFQDRFVGEILIFYSEIRNIEPYKNRGNYD